MKKLSIALFTMAMATGCTVNGKPMFGLGAKGPSAPSAPASMPSTESAESSSNPADDPEFGVPQNKMDVDCMREGFQDQRSCDAARSQQWLPRLTSAIEKAATKLDDDGQTQISCTRLYERAVTQGIPPSIKITVKGQSGTLEALHKKYCVDAVPQLHKQRDERIAAQKAAFEANVRKHLKGDKAELALTNWNVYWVDDTGPVKSIGMLAKANVWYYPLQEDGYCSSNGGRRYSLRKITFNKDKKVKERTDSFCGEPPDSAYRR